MDEHSLLQCLDLELPAQIYNSIEQDFLLHEKKKNKKIKKKKIIIMIIIYPAVVHVIYEHEESQQNSEEIERSKTLVGMPTFTIKEIEKHSQLSGKIQGLLITKTLV